MMTGYENKMLKLNTPLAGRPAGAQVRIAVDKDGTPMDQYWRRRMKDAQTDNCVEIIEPKKASTKENK